MNRFVLPGVVSLSVLWLGACQRNEDAAVTSLGAGQKAEMRAITADGIGDSLGGVILADSAEGLVLTLDLRNLPPGLHGFHVHENHDCEAGEKDGHRQPGLAAGEHYDPEHTGRHAGPDGAGHAGDLPRLEVKADGSATGRLVAPRLKLADVEHRSLIIHADPDDFGEKPGGARIACGVIG